MPKLVLPRVQAMLVCDASEEAAEEDGVFELHGVRTAIQADAFPFERRRLHVFLQMSGHVGEAAINIEVIRAETDEMLYQSHRKLIAFQDPVSVIPLAFVVRNCRFPASGVYYVQAYHENKIISERSLILQAED